MEEVFKIVRSGFKTLYHGINRTRTIPLNQWVKGENKTVTDGSGGKEYLSGIHCFKNLEQGQNYLNRFKRNKEDLMIIRCKARGLRQKPTNTNVWLADEIYIDSEDYESN